MYLIGTCKFDSEVDKNQYPYLAVQVSAYQSVCELVSGSKVNVWMS